MYVREPIFPEMWLLHEYKTRFVKRIVNLINYIIKIVY